MLTRCPGCETTFRVTAEQLKARHGKVRCGACQKVFNALDTLVEAPVVVPTPVPPAEEAATAVVTDGASSAPDAMNAGAIDATYPDQEAPSSADEPPETAAAIPAEVLVEAHPPLEDSTVLPAESASPPSELGIDSEIAAEAPATSSTETSVELSSEPAELASMNPTAAWTSAESVETAAGAPPQADPAPPAADLPEADRFADPNLVAPLLTEPPRRTRRWPWLLGAVMALATLALQVAMHFRTEIVVLHPETRPAFLAACDLLACQLRLPRKAALMSIETSDLHPDADGRLTLSATLKNRAPFAQEYPALELTLTDTADRALVRRVLAPADYLSPRLLPDTGLAAGKEVPVDLSIEAPEVAAAGYRLYLFYP